MFRGSSSSSAPFPLLLSARRNSSRGLWTTHTIYSSKPGSRRATTYHRRTSIPTCSSLAKRRPSARTRKLRRTARRGRTAKSPRILLDTIRSPCPKKVKEYLCFYDEKVDSKFEGYWQRPLNLLRDRKSV